MIEVELAVGRGDREMKQIRDDLIRTQDIALIRAREELASSMTIIKSRNIQMFRVEDVDPGDEATFACAKLDISGVHRVSSVSLHINKEKVVHNIIVEQYGSTP
jgi:hypothetical protein